MQPDITQQTTTPQPTIASDVTATPLPPKRNNLVVIVLVFIILVLLIALGYLLYQTSQKETTITVPITTAQPTIEAFASPSSVAKPNNDQWVTATDLGFTFEYPTGWHVADIWPSDFKNGILLVMDSKPISTAPRDTPLGTFTLRIISGQPNPEEILQQEMSNYTDQNYDNLQTEVFQTSLADIHYYKGNIAGEYLKGHPVEAYIFITPQKGDDKLNRQVVVATTLSEEPGISDRFRHIIMSLKFTNP